jgi:2-methylcitrate dehydratase PrpD
MANGASFSEEVRLMPGDPEIPLTWQDLTQKFAHITHPFLDKESRKKIPEMVFSMEHLKDIQRLTRLLRFEANITY